MAWGVTFDTRKFDFHLPDELIARHPSAERDRSRLMGVDPSQNLIEDLGHFHSLPNYLGPGDLLVINDTGVFKARLIGKRHSGGKVEILLLGNEGPVVKALLRPLTKLKIGEEILIGDSCARLLRKLPDGPAELDFGTDLERVIESQGMMPIPPYLKRASEPGDADRYQTVFAKAKRSVAAPTASLHFTPELLSELAAKGVEIVALTLEVGYGTFAPLSPGQTELHPEKYVISEKTAQRLTSGKRIVAAGTTVVRALESFALSGRREGETRIFIRDGFSFQMTDAMITNFHVPNSSLLHLVHAFAGDILIDAYEKAIAWRFRFFSYGDAMLIKNRRVLTS